MEIYTFPYIVQNRKLDIQSSLYNNKIHKTLLKKLTSGARFIPEINYVDKIIDIDMIDNISKHKYIYNGARGLDDLISYYDSNIIDSNIVNESILKKSKRIDTLLNKLKNINSDLIDENSINRLIDKNNSLRRKEENKTRKSNIYRMLKIDIEQPSLNDEWLEYIFQNDEWLIDIVELFKDITNAGLIFRRECFKMSDNSNIQPLDYFLFSKEGKLIYFIGFNSIAYNFKYLNKNFKELNILDNNIRAFVDFIESIFFYCSIKQNELANEELSIKLYEELNKKHDSGILKIYDKCKENHINFTSFQEILEIIKNKRTKKAREKIGIYLDTANIYVGMQSLDIDFNHLFISIYGVDALKKIKYKFATVFYPRYEDDKKTKEIRNIQKKLKTNLEYYGFEVKVLENGQSKAKQCDDKELLLLMKNTIEHVEKVLLMTGDAHFYDIACRCLEEDKEVKVISVCEDDTSDLFKEKFKDNHSYIYEHWESIKLYRKWGEEK